ncbi:S8 family serine peptidase [Desulfococcaceae bacterium HSG8]|nr:S8 family serine peptidase [Desulfococcaceae bacterium HSG8]
MSPDIAIIDSGINPWHIHVQGVEGGIAFYSDSEGLTTDGDFRDAIGHGTAIAGIIREKIPSARMYAVKIFHEELNAPVSLLLGALEWAIDKNIKIIHLSLGTERETYRNELESLCQYAFDKGIVMLAAARSPDDRVFPSVFETVIGVCWDRGCNETSIRYYPGEKVEFGAYGWPRAIPGLPQEKNFCGNSFAAAHITARVAQLLERNPGAEPLQIKEMLIKMASKNSEQRATF